MVPVANTLVPFADDNLAVLPAVRRTQSSTSLLSASCLRELFDVLREQYDFILIDSPPILPLSDMNIFCRRGRWHCYNCKGRKYDKRYSRESS